MNTVTFNFCGIKISRFNENNLLAHLNFGFHDITGLQEVNNFCCKFVTIKSFLTSLLNYLLDGIEYPPVPLFI